MKKPGMFERGIHELYDHDPVSAFSHFLNPGNTHWASGVAG